MEATAAGKVPGKDDLADEFDGLLNETTKSCDKASTSSAENDEITGVEENLSQTFSENSLENSERDDDLMKLCESVEKEDANMSLTELDKTDDPVEKVLEISELEKDKSCETSDKVDDSSSKSESNLVNEPLPDDLESAENPEDKVESENVTKSSNDQIVEIAEMMETSGIVSGDDDEPMVIDEDETSQTKESNKPVETSSAIAESSRKRGSENDKSSTPEQSDSETPEDIIKLLKNLSPEKLQAIKSKVFMNVKDSVNEKAPLPSAEVQMEVDAVAEPATATTFEESTSPSPVIEAINKPDKIVDESEDCVILLDSDDDDEPETASLPPKVSDTKADDQSCVVSSSDKCAKTEDEAQSTLPSQPEQKSDEMLTKLNKMNKKECINPNCLRDSPCYDVSTQFVLNFYYVSKKPSSVQYVCGSCNDKAILKYEELGAALLNNMPLFKVVTHKKHEMVEVIDSDDEDEQAEPSTVTDAEKIVWNKDVELQAEEILQQLCNKVDLKQQLKWNRDDLDKRGKKLDEEQMEFENELKLLEMKSSNMYNDLYSINKPRIERRPSLDITYEHRERDPQSSLKVLLTGKKMQIAQSKISLKSQPAASILKASPSALTRQSPFAPQPGKKIVISPSFPTRSVLAPPAIPALPEMQKNQVFYAVRSRVFGRMQTWAPCKLLETIAPTKDGAQMYRVQFFDQQPNNVVLVKGKDFATNKFNRTLKIGARVIAMFTRPAAKGKELSKKFLPGVIGEKLSNYNNHRYLVFCDYGQVQYSAPESVREISESSPNVWEDVHENLRQFIYDYLQSQTMRQRALLNVRPNQRVATERNGKWNTATVLEIDCSVVKMLFPENSVEWLYRGSKRLGPLYSQGHRGAATNARRNDPNISYITIDEDDDQSTPASEADADPTETKRNTARKSTAPAPQHRALQPQRALAPASVPAANVPSQIILNDNNIYLEEPKQITKFRHFTPRKDIAAKRYEKHSCSPTCLMGQPSLLNHSPLSKPLLTCWERQIVRQKGNRWIQYKAPCGRRLRNMHEIRIYLIMTKCNLNVDNFDFDVSIQVLYAYDVIDKNICPLYIPDMSEGKEGMKIPVINAFDDTRPPKLEYSAHRIPMKGVHINTDPEFLACCDCTDDCADKASCACFQMTIQGMKCGSRGENLQDENISYEWKRLLRQVSTGIYECHSRCKCSSRCLNKVVQNPIQVKMQLYRTKNRGWGLECCHDIPNGTFICIYAGRLYTEAEANALCQGQDHGDEYFAELDLIETATPYKEGFENGVKYEDSESEEEEKASDSDSDYDEKKAREDEQFSLNQLTRHGREILTRSARSEKSKGSDPQGANSSNDSDSDGEMVNMLPTAGTDSGAPPKPSRAFRKLYGKNEKVYIMDAKLCGNVGRYFNHSCDPNLIVQSVFVDTHDMRFPWIAFFATRAIKAGEELTWNYNYDVGSVASKCLYCKCGAKNCRGRIL